MNPMHQKLLKGIISDLMKVPMKGGAMKAPKDDDDSQIEGLSNPDDEDAMKGDEVMPHGAMKHKFPRKGI